MYKITRKRYLNPSVALMKVEAPLVARAAKPGQFIVFRVDDLGERVPLTIADAEPASGEITIIFQIIGLSTRLLSEKNEGEFILDIAGPLGQPTETAGAKRVCVVGGGVGCAIAYPQAKALHSAGVYVDMLAGFRNKDIVILETEMRGQSDNLYITTDDGSYGEKGFVTAKLQSLIEGGAGYDLIIAIGPVIMMKLLCGIAKKAGIRAIVSLNPIMIDGTGMCGCCRVTVGGRTRFACVDGPDFDGHLVDFDELSRRNSVYREQEAAAMEKHVCRLTGRETANG
ncbi:MAG: sulfide/dihydroorotate dehydrogenase-like FAD/NAD-binding protein [Clostridiales bacterium]|jgi:ferredoxin--NADP+ reductase|nr:sulfide/dihydroorotate dehydrogenase-like FAD/NAD-binding protein [Clostridiales bacterium]